MLNAFLEEHARDIKEASSLNLKDFRAFRYRIPGIVRKSVQPVLGKREPSETIKLCTHRTEKSGGTYVQYLDDSTPHGVLLAA